MKELTLDKIKSIELDILKYIDDVCIKNNIIYYLSYGTLLGAIRHKGFIPWDDDIDIVMPREDYNRFIQLMRSSNHDRYELKEPGVDGYYYEFAKISDSKTIVNQIFVDDINMGLWVDIFPLDAMTASSLKHKYLYFLQRCRVAAVHKRCPNSSLILKPFVYLYWRICKEIGWKWFLNKQLKISEEYSYGSTPTIGFKASGMRKPELLPIEWFGNIEKVEFEGLHFNAPQKWDLYLTSLYGDYMTLPPVEQRVPHKVEAYFKE